MSTHLRCKAFLSIDGGLKPTPFRLGTHYNEQWVNALCRADLYPHILFSPFRFKIFINT